MINSHANRGSAGARGEAEGARATTHGFHTAASAPCGAVLALLVGLAASAACESSTTKQAEALTGGSVRRGSAAIGKYGCAACHTIPRIDGADATVGPPLDRIAARPSLGGRVPNTPDNLIKWIQRPQSVDPKNVMPDLGVTDQDARDIVAFLYTLR